MKLPALRGCLRELGWRHTILEHATGGIVVALERGARILGVYPDAEGDNLVWVCPDLADREAAESRFSQTPGWNTGGERCWLSPEVEFHIRDLQDSDSYTVQSAIDPGHYRMADGETGSASAQWRQTGTAQAYRSGGALSFRMQKTCRMVEDPLQGSRPQAGRSCLCVCRL